MRAIVFDLDGTLLTSPVPYREVLASAFEATAGDVRDDWLETYDEAFATAFEACETEPVRTAVGELGEGPDPDAFATTLHAAEVETFEPAPDVHATLDRLADDFELAVCTNGVGEWQRAKLRAHDLLDPFDAVVSSYEVGAHKPNRAPFRAVERELSAETYGMIGDSDDDLLGARSAGWDATRYTGGGFSDLPAAFGWSDANP